ncbi:Cytochrome oxidase Cu insertion factor, SCO1/SenC/PrrC family [Microbacterium sp. cf046]|uniref:SCO family protein n=1 Tax=Microbacterium sp. cf046 TaxID=1761803 RepID=UPI0008F30BAA|nr:SCO family protein [Microbacterium sp. cf046]SFS14802.1 Cytochrome oxidase Cu insertion factor, SCO1/SenC/PrrC family [Microbacterium sp. cf046]
MSRDVDGLIAQLLAVPVTAAGLRQDAAHLAGLSTVDAERVRAHLLASFEATGIPEGAVPVVAEELRTAASPVVLAGAARAVRGVQPGSPEDVEWEPLLRDAATRIETTDVFVRWQARVVPPGWMRTARGEILALLAERADRSAAVAEISHEPGPEFALDAEAVRAVRLEDQDAATPALADALARHPTIVAFFYTRCMNPAKCSLTITRLAAVARYRPGDFGILAISYDPDFDTADRLHRYGAERGFPFGEHARLARATAGWQETRAMFGLRVGYGPVTVNEHARELFLVGADPITGALVARGLDPDAIAEPHLVPVASLR